jgi:CRP/FNR family transcriptional regulator
VNLGCWRNPPRRLKVMRVTREAPLGRGARLTVPDATRDHLWLVRSGAMKVTRLNDDGSETVLDFRLPGDLLACTAQLRPHTSTHFTAIAETSLCRLTPPKHGEPESEIEFWRLVAGASQAQLDLALEPWSALASTERVARFINYLSKRLAREDGGGFELPMTRAEIGSRLGLTEESVCRALRTLHSSGRYEICGRRVRANTLTHFA